VGQGRTFLGEMDASWSFCFSVDSKGINAFARSHEHVLEICDVVLRLLTASVHSVKLSYWNAPHHVFINATSLAYLMEQCQSLTALALEQIAMGLAPIRDRSGAS
jgi:hypothetical protein